MNQVKFSQQGDGSLAKNTVSNTINAVAVAFRKTDKKIPTRMQQSATLANFYNSN
jgi:hypothetical protein